MVWLFRDRLQGETHEPGSLVGGFDLLTRALRLRAASIFLYVGAEVAIGSLILHYLM